MSKVPLGVIPHWVGPNAGFCQCECSVFQVILASSEWEAAEHFCGLGLGLAISTIASSWEGKK